MGAILEVNSLKKYFPVGGRTLHAVDDVTFSINQGETLGVVGEGHMVRCLRAQEGQV